MFEALIGAIYLDMGYDFTNRLLINGIYVEHLDMKSLQQVETDFKSRLIEWAQKEHHKLEFVTRIEAHDRSKPPVFSSIVYIADMEIGHGYGSSKKEAEQNAAYSVAQGGQSLSDDHTDKILSKIDKMESDRRSSDDVVADENNDNSPKDVHID